VVASHSASSLQWRGWFPAVGALALLAQTGWAQLASPWRAFKEADGLPEAFCSSVTVSPHGTVLVRHLLAPFVTRLDGYTLTKLPAPPTRSGRIYETRAGQLWTATTNGLLEFKDGQWTLHPVPEIAADSASGGSASGPPLFPVRQGRLLVLLRDALLAVNVSGGGAFTSEVLRRADSEPIGRFTGLIPARDGGLWISGMLGVAKVPGPMRQLNSHTVWKVFLPPPASGVSALREPREDAEGGVTVIGTLTNGNTVVARFDGVSWALGSPPEGERPRIAWRSADGHDWLLTSSTLWMRAPAATQWIANEDCASHKFFDAALEPGGAFWVATVDGLFRYAPLPWRAPAAAIRELGGPVHGLTRDAAGRMWFLIGEELCSWDETRLERFNPPPSLRRAVLTAQEIFPLANGALLLSGGGELVEFLPARGTFRRLETARPARVLGARRPGVALLCEAASADAPVRLFTYDGARFGAPGFTPPATLAAGEPVAVFATRSGPVWLSTENGLGRWREGHWDVWVEGEKPAPRQAEFFLETGEDGVICANARELWSFENGAWTPLRIGFDRINALTRGPDNQVWVGSSSGLHRQTPAGWLDNGVEDGLPGNVIRAFCRDRRGRLWIAASQGLSVCYPETDTEPPRSEVFMPAGLSLSEGASLTVVFGAQDKWKFTPRNRILYSWRLDERDWSPLQELNSVTLPELAAGRHVFQVRAADRNGNIERRPATCAFEVALPWYRETRLVVIGTLGAAAALFFAALAFHRHRLLRRSYAEVERKVAERTRELERAHQELLLSQKMQALGTLAAGIAHDFNSILSIIKGSAQLIEENPDDPQKVRARLERIKAVVEQGAGVVQALLGFSRNSDGAWQACDVNEVLRDTVKLLGDRFVREVEIVLHPAPELPRLPMARDLVQQILLNFIFNAAESMTGKKRILLSAARWERLPDRLALAPVHAPAYVALSVQDFGCGIPPENLPRIFEPFFTTKAFSTRRGTGLGLSMVYELAKRLGAGLAVESEVGVGSTFTLLLPLSATAQAAGAAMTPTPARETLADARPTEARAPQSAPTP
jgi:signal transduction histidine kinase